MFARIAALAHVFLLAACVVSAAHVPEKRQIFDTLTSAFGAATSDAASFFTDATSFAGSAFTDATSLGGSVFTQATSGAGSLISQGTSLAGDVGTIVTSAAGHAETIITQKGGEIFTLATSGAAGVLTTVNGAVYTAEAAATGTTTPNAAMGSFSPATQMFSSLAAVLSGIFLGAWIIL